MRKMPDKKIKEKIFRFCLECGSINTKMTTIPWKVGGGALSHYRCMDCSYDGHMLEGNLKAIKKFKGKLKIKK